MSAHAKQDSFMFQLTRQSQEPLASLTPLPMLPKFLQQSQWPFHCKNFSRYKASFRHFSFEPTRVMKKSCGEKIQVRIWAMLPSVQCSGDKRRHTRVVQKILAQNLDQRQVAGNCLDDQDPIGPKDAKSFL